MAFLKDIWYVAAWAHEVTDSLLARTLLDEPVVLYRDASGAPHALEDRCPHRFAPLSMGRLVEDRIQCGYHGLEFDGEGTLVGNPHGSALPASCRVKSYPIIEKYGVVWIWPGAPKKADAELIPDFGYLIEPERKTVYGGTVVKANYELISDNLMDASHTQYVHLDLLGTSAFANSEHEVIQDGDTVHSNYRVPHSKVLTAYRDYFDEGIDDVEYAVRFQWRPPGLVTNRVSLVPYDTGARAIYRTGTHLMTPETETSTHYFFAHTRNFQIDDLEVDERTRRWQKLGLTDQDGPMIEACQARMGERTDLMAMKPSLFSFDEAAVRVRRVMASLVDRQSMAPSLRQPDRRSCRSKL